VQKGKIAKMSVFLRFFSFFNTFLHKLTADFTDLHRNLATLKIRAKIGVEKSRGKMKIFSKIF